MSRKEWISARQAAEEVGVSGQTIKNWCNKGLVKAKKIEGFVYVNRKSLAECKKFKDQIIRAETSVDEYLQECEEAKSELIKKTKEYKQKKEELRLHILDTDRYERHKKTFYSLLLSAICCVLRVNDINKANKIDSRFADMLINLLSGSTIDEMSIKYGITTSRIALIIGKGIYKLENTIDELYNANCIHDYIKQNADMLKETSQLKDQVKFLERCYGHDGDATEGQKKFDLMVTMQKSLEDCNISIRALNICRSADIRTIGDLATKKKMDLLHVRNCGKRCISELEDLLASYKLSFTNDDKFSDRIRKMEIKELMKREDAIKMRYILNNKISDAIPSVIITRMSHLAGFRYIKDIVSISNEDTFCKISGFSNDDILKIFDYRRQNDLYFGLDVDSILFEKI